MTQEDTRPRLQSRVRDGHEVEALTLAYQPVAVVRGRVRTDEISVFLTHAFDEVEAMAASGGIAIVGPPFARFASAGGRMEVEAGFPVDREVESSGCVVASDLPGGHAACVMHRGSFEEVAAAYDKVERWVRAQGCTRDGDPWEVYLDAPGETAPRTLVYLPYLPPTPA